MPAPVLKNLARFFPLILSLIVLNFCYAQPAEQFIKVVVAPDHADWTYAPGEKVKFTITVLQSGNILKNAVVKYEIGPEKMDPVKKDSLLVANGTLAIDGGTMKEAGFLRCIATAIVNNKSYRGLATAAFSPLQIEPTIANPSDFTIFGSRQKQNWQKFLWMQE